MDEALEEALRRIRNELDDVVTALHTANLIDYLDILHKNRFELAEAGYNVTAVNTKIDQLHTLIEERLGLGVSLNN